MSVLDGNHTSGTGWMASHLRMFGRGSPRKELFADETPAHVLTDDKEHLAYLIGARGARVSLSCVVSCHVDQQ
jgi:hypothetical protein